MPIYSNGASRLRFYSDKHGVFRSTHASMKDRTSGLTPFGRALYELNIDIIAPTPRRRKAVWSAPIRRCRIGW